MAEGVEASVITLGGKGSSLSSSSVYAISHALSQVRLDSSVLDRLSSSSTHPKSAFLKHQILLPSFLTLEEARASLVFLLNKLLLSATSSIRPLLPALIADTLNKNPETLCFEPFDVTVDELSVLQQSYFSLNGICALLDYKLVCLSIIVDAIAAMSFEASKADVAVFNLMDSGDGFTAKEEVGVANDMKVLLNGSKLVGKTESGGFLKILKAHACLREQVKLLHVKMRVELNSGVKVGKGGSGSSGTQDALRTALLPLAAALWDLGKCSLDRQKMTLEKICYDSVRSSLVGLFEKECPDRDSLKRGFKLVSELVLEEKYDELVHNVNVLLSTVWRIVVWEAITAFVALEAGDLIENFQSNQVNGGSVKAEKKSEKKKKVVLGKGTSMILPLIKDRVQRKEYNDDVNSLILLDKWARDLVSFLDPNDLEFDGFVKKVKEIVESNESRRLPKLPKVTIIWISFSQFRFEVLHFPFSLG